VPQTCDDSIFAGGVANLTIVVVGGGGWVVRDGSDLVL